MSSAISRIAAIVIVIVLIIVALGASFALLTGRTSSSSSSTSTSASGSSTSTGSISSASSTTITNTGSNTTPTTTSPTSVSSSSSSSSGSGPTYGGTLIADETFEPGNIDPSTTNSVSGLAIDANVLDTLVTYNWTTKQIVPRLATNWTASANGLTYNFSLRSGVHFVDPSTNSTLAQFNATDVQYSWTRVLAQANGYVFATAGLNMSTFHIVNPFSFSVKLNANFSAFIPTVADYLNAIIDMDVDVAHGGYHANNISTFMGSNLVGTGPYMMTQFVQGDHITLVRNPFYWGPRPYLDKIIINYRNDPSTRLLDIKGGAVQVSNIDPDLVPQVNGTSGIVVKTIGLSDNIAPIGLNVHKFPTDNIYVREAIVHAINYSFIDQSIFAGLATAFQGPIPKGMFGYNDSFTPFDTNLTEAKSDMAKAGYANGMFSNGTAIPPITFVYPFDWPSGGLVAQAIQSDLANIGLQVNLESATSPSYAAITALAFNATNRPEMLAYFWTPDYNDPADYAVPSSSFGFAGGYDNSTVESLGAQALSTQNQVLRAQLYSQITGIVAHDSPMVWTYQYVGYAVYTSKVNGLIYNSLLDGYGFEWQTVWLSP